VIFRILFLLFGVYTASLAVIIIRASATPPAVLAAWRQLIAAIVLSPFFLRALMSGRHEFGLKEFKAAGWSGLVLSLHFLTWIVGARLTTAAANASLIVNMAPVVMPFFLFALIREKVTNREVLGTLVAVSGAVLLGWSDVRIGEQGVLGDALCLISMLLLCFYMALGRKNRQFGSVWLYIVPLYFCGGLVCLAVSPFMGADPTVYDTHEILLIIALGLVPTVMGHSIFNYSMRHIRGQVVSMCTLFEFVFAGIMAWIFFDEIPSGAFYPAATLVVGGALIVLTQSNHSNPRSRNSAATGKLTT